jgi:hypothetical protein
MHYPISSVWVFAYGCEAERKLFQIGYYGNGHGVWFTGPFRRARETRPGRNGKVPTRPTRILLPPIRSDRGSCQQRDRPSNAPSLSWCRDGAFHLQAQAGVPAVLEQKENTESMGGKSVSRRKGELTAAATDRGWPHQVAVPATDCRASYGRFMDAFLPRPVGVRAASQCLS